MYTYKNKKTGKILKVQTPLKGLEKREYILVEWGSNVIIKSREVIKK